MQFSNKYLPFFSLAINLELRAQVRIGAINYILCSEEKKSQSFSIFKLPKDTVMSWNGTI